MRSGKYVLVGAVLLAALCLRVAAARQRLMAWGDNGAAVMDVGRHLAAGEGYRTLRVWTYYGEPQSLPRPEGNRQPLLPLLAAGVFRSGIPAFRGVQTVVLLFGMATVVLAYYFAKRLFGWKGGLAGAALIAMSPVHTWFSAQVEDQMLLQFFFLLLLVVLDAAPSRRRALIAGAVCGFAYLSRTNGLLVMAALLGVLWWEHRRWPEPVLALAGFVAVSLPWLMRNAWAFGNPLFTENSYFLWSGSFESVFSVRAAPPTPLTYFRENGGWTAAARFVKGAYLSVEAFLLGNIFRREPFSQPSLVPAIFLAWLAYRRRMTSSTRLVIAALVLHFVSVSWHQHGTFRYYLPFYGWILIGAGEGALRAARGHASVSRLRGWAVALVLVFPLVRPLTLLLTHREDRLHGETAAVAEWLAGHTAPSEVVLDYPHVEKLVYRYRRPTLLAPTGTMDDVMTVARAYRVRYLVVDPDLLSWRPQFGALWEARDDGPREIAALEGLRLAYRSPRGRCLVYEVSGQARAETITRKGPTATTLLP
jgi:hypothetical protein